MRERVMGIREVPKPIIPAREILEYNRTLELVYTRPLRMWVCVLCVCLVRVDGVGVENVRTSNNTYFIILIYLQRYPCYWVLFHVS